MAYDFNRYSSTAVIQLSTLFMFKYTSTNGKSHISTIYKKKYLSTHILFHKQKKKKKKKERNPPSPSGGFHKSFF